MPGVFVTVKEAAQALGVSEETVRRWFRLGTIEGIKLGPRLIRVPAKEIERLLAGEARDGGQ